jgi:transposase-like protein
MPRRSELSVEQRRDAVLALLRKEEPGAQLARRFGVSEQTLYRWRDEFLAGGEAALAGGKNGSTDKSREKELRAQLEERDLVIGELTVANRILKKLSGQSP